MRFDWEGAQEDPQDRLRRHLQDPHHQDRRDRRDHQGRLVDPGPRIHSRDDPDPQIDLRDWCYRVDQGAAEWTAPSPSEYLTSIEV